MFTGIIEAVGRVQTIEDRKGDKRLTIEVGKLDMSDVALGDSIACNGVCLTVIAKSAQTFSADVSSETIRLTGFRHYQSGQSLNLEKALTPNKRLGGHLVSGHVDGVGRVIARWDDARAVRFSIEAPMELAKYIAYKGSITVDGVSLTVNKVEANVFELTIVPHTLSETIMAGYKAGSAVNLEVDQIARYLERLLQYSDKKSATITESLLANAGFIQ